MATFPVDPNLPAVTTTTEVNPAFLNTFVDNINAIGAALGDLVNNTADGNIDLAIDKGIQWANSTKVYMSGGVLILDNAVSVTGNLSVAGTVSGTLSLGSNIDVVGTLTVDTIDDHAAGVITFNENVILAAGKEVDTPTLKADVIDDSGAAEITVNEDLHLAAGKYVDTPEIKNSTGTLAITGDADISGILTIDTINDSGAASITVNESMDFAAGKYIDTPTLKADTIDDSGAASITVNESMDIAAGKYIDTPTLKADTIDDSGAASITVNESMDIAAGKYIDTPTLKADIIDDSGAANITVNEDIALSAGKELYAPSLRSGTLEITGNADISGTLSVDTINDSGATEITINEDLHLATGKYVDTPEIKNSSGTLAVTGNMAVTGNIEIDGNLNHDGSYIGFFGKTPAAIAPAYVLGNRTPDRSYDADAVLIAELADVVGTLIYDLASYGLLTIVE